MLAHIHFVTTKMECNRTKIMARNEALYLTSNSNKKFNCNNNNNNNNNNNKLIPRKFNSGTKNSL